MRVVVRLYATLRKHSERVDGTVRLELPENVSVAGIMELLNVPLEEISVALVNGKRAALSDRLSDGDRIELVPPIAGG